MRGGTPVPDRASSSSTTASDSDVLRCKSMVLKRRFAPNPKGETQEALGVSYVFIGTSGLDCLICAMFARQWNPGTHRQERETGVVKLPVRYARRAPARC